MFIELRSCPSFNGKNVIIGSIQPPNTDTDSVLHSAKKNYFSKKFKESTNNIKSSWNIINQLLNKKKKTSLGLSSQFVNGNEFIRDPFEIQSDFNQ